MVFSRMRLVGLVLAAVVVAASVYLVARPDMCDGIPRSFGACSADRPTYGGETCDEVAIEWGRQLDGRVMEVVDGPDAVGDQSQSSRLLDAVALTTQLANKHLRDSGLTVDCSAERFMELGEAQFSNRLLDEVGTVMYQGNPVVDYSEWRVTIVEFVELIMQDPELPYS